jgi:GGDEF domain-containing protein
MVAKRLSDVGGDGQAFRCGGEEFAIVFRNTSAKEALEHLEALRQRIEKSTFQVRGADRRAERTAESTAEKSSNRRAGTSLSDRRKSAKRKNAAASSSKQRDLFPHLASQSPDRSSDRLSNHLSVTVSIGVAEPGTRNRQPEQVIQSADQALYRAKHNGRNRVELASTAPLRLAERKRAKAPRL